MTKNKIPVVRRSRCPLCESSNLTSGLEPHVALPYPLLPVCVDTPREEDLTAPFTIASCEDCGLITLLDYVEPEILYKAFHNDAVGKLWVEHYQAFASLIASHYTLGTAGRIVEVGAGQGKLLRILRPLCGGIMEVIDPQYEGPPEGVTVHPCLLDPVSAAPLAGQFDALVSSHTLEHFPEFNAYFSAARTVLKPNGLLFTSVPNQEYGFAKAHGSMLSFEHPSVCTNLHWLALFYRNGFQVNEVRLFKGHSIMVSAQRVETKIAFTLNARELSQTLLADYTKATLDRLERIRSAATSDKENWLFGAHNNAQVSYSFNSVLSQDGNTR
jgi:SAM-dependent methyltransferase